MNKRPLKFSVLVSVILLLLAGAVGLSWHLQQKQYLRNRQLIAALLHNDDQQALTLVNEGADPNTPYRPTPVPPLLERIKQLFHLTPSPENSSPTAFLIVCDVYDYSVDDQDALNTAQKNRSDNAPLVQGMLAHGANVNAHSSLGPNVGYNIPALVWVADANRRNTVEVLLQHGADVNAKGDGGMTPLMYATDGGPDVVRLLLQHGADVNALDENGDTALYWAVANSANNDIAIIRQLLASGANPNHADKAGVTPLQAAQRNKRSDIIALLKHAAATK